MALPEMWMPLPRLPAITLVRRMLLPPVDVIRNAVQAVADGVSTNAGSPQKVLKHDRAAGRVLDLDAIFVVAGDDIAERNDAAELSVSG